MSQETIATESVERTRIEPYWYLIALFLFGGLAVFIYHLVTKNTPNNVAIHIPFLNFDVFWYGIIIVSGIALGSYVTSRLALDRAVSVFDQHVPFDLQQKPVSDLKLRKVILEVLEKGKIENIGELLFQWGLNPDRTGLNRAGQTDVRKHLEKLAGVEKSWLSDAPWRQWNPDFVWGGVAWVIIFGVIGARLYHILTPSPSMAAVGINSALDYFQNPMQLINIRSGGLGIYGAILGGLLGLVLYTRRHHISAIAWADLAAVGLALGQFVGRWGNFFNQELYGRPSDLPWAIYIDPVYRLDAYINNPRFHPAFLYASLWNLLTFIVLWVLAKKYSRKLQTGDLMALYLVFYSIGRIILELFRLDSRNLSLAGVDLGIPVATLVSIVIALPMAALLIYRHLLAKDSI